MALNSKRGVGSAAVARGRLLRIGAYFESVVFGAGRSGRTFVPLLESAGLLQPTMAASETITNSVVNRRAVAIMNRSLFGPFPTG